MITMNAEIFKNHILESEKPVLVEFWAPWCGYCRRIGPAMEAIAKRTADTLTVGKLNIDEEPALSDEEQIEVIPTLVIYHKGKALGSIVAPESRAVIEQFIHDTLGR